MSSRLQAAREPDDVRALFCVRLEVTGGDEADPELRQLAGQLWGFTDPLPARHSALLGLPPGATYAMAARALRLRGGPLPPYAPRA